MTGTDATRAPTPFDPLGPLERGTTLLEASAGTGKTYSITSLYVRLVIEAGIPVEEILAVTFTQAATAELTARIRKRLGQAHRVLHERVKIGTFDPDDEVLKKLAELPTDSQEAVEYAERARAAVEAFDRANITTIHGFCQRMLSQHALEAQVPFGVELIEDHAALIQEIADDFWVRVTAVAEPWELQTLATIGVDLDSMRRLAHNAVNHWDAVPSPAAPLASSADDLTRPDASALIAALHAAAEVARQASTQGDLADLRQRIAGVSAFVVNTSEWKQLPRAIEHLAQNRVTAADLPTLAVLDPRTLRAHVPTGPLPPIADAVAELLRAHAEWRPRALPWGLALRHALVAEVRREHERRTRQRGVWSYDDLLRSLRDALCSTSRPHIAESLRQAIGRRFQAVLIDEFQDTDPIQWAIFERVFARRDHYLYLIGDPKQAIYGFRRADVHTYLEVAARADRLFTLTTNFRSDRPLVEALNGLFGAKNPENAFAVRGIPYRPVDPHHGARVEGLRSAPLRVLWVKRTKQAVGARARAVDTGRISYRWGEEQLPAMVAADVVRALESGIEIVEGPERRRPLAPSDCAVLVQKNDQAVKVQEALRRANVPAVVHGPRSVFETDEAKELLRVLTAVLDPSRMPAVRAALLTRLLGVTAFDLARWEEDDPRALERRIDDLREWREAWLKRSFIEAFRKLTSERVETLLGLEDGERRLANHLQLGELLHLAVAQRDLKPPGLVAWLERQIQRADKTDDRQQVRLETDEPAVQVVTVHKAKGLEYPFVWCPFLWQKPSDATGRKVADFVYRDALVAPGATAIPRLELGLDGDDPSRLRAHGALVYGEQSERLRTLYVALTRAKHQVTLYGGAFWDLPESPLGYVLFSGRTAHDAASLWQEARVLGSVNRRSDTELVHALEAAFADHPISFEEVSAVRGSPRRYRPPHDEDPLERRVWPEGRKLDVFWRRTSFSGLVQEAGADHEERLQAASDEGAAEDLFLPSTGDREILLANLPSGRAIGNCIHKILELADFRDPAALGPLVARELAHHGVDAAHGETLTAALQAVLTTPLDASGFTLSQLGPRERLPELAFVFPVSGGYHTTETAFTHRALVRAFRQYGPPALESWLQRFDAVVFSSVRGFLSGSLDLAFRAPHDQRWYIVDWKSNHLGKTARDYGPRQLRGAMDEHHYHLQYHLYSIALCRYLAQRQPGFSVERDFGGALYLFLRGMHPDHPLGAGIYHDRPSPSLLEELERALRGEPDPRRGQLGLHL